MPRPAGAGDSAGVLGRFALVGASGYVVNLCVFAAVETALRPGHIVSGSVAFAAAVTSNYAGNSRWTFAGTETRARRGAPRFVAVSLAGLLVNLVVLSVLVRAGLAPLAAQGVAVLVAIPVTFLGSKLWSFRPEPGATAGFEQVLVLPATGTATPRVVVCLPTYNERQNLEPMVDALTDVLGARDVVLVVDDSSPDGTGELADRLAHERSNVAVMHRPTKSGLGRAYVDAVRYALSLGAEYVLEMDCDFSHDPADVPRLLDAAERADLAIGSRYVEGGSAEGLSRPRRMLSRAGSAYSAAVLGLRIRDLTGGFKCFRRGVFDRLDLGAITSTGYAFQIETTWRTVNSGARVAEVPIGFSERAAGSSKMNPGIALEALLKVPELRLLALGQAVARTLRRYLWIVRWWALSRALVFLPALVVQLTGWPRRAWYPSMLARPFALLGAWDGRWYRMVATRGYLVVPHRQSDTAFFPLYPITMRVLHPLGISLETAGLLIANLGFLVGLVALYELARTWLPEADARRTVVYAALFPFGFVFSMVYPEGMVLAAFALAGLLAARGRWVGAGVLAAVATLGRPEGVLLTIPIAALAVRRFRSLDGRARGRALGAVTSAPAALAGLCAYEGLVTGDPLAFSHAQVQWGRWTSASGIVRAVHELAHASTLHREWLYRDAAFCLVYLLALLLAWRGGVPASWISVGALIVLLPLWSGSFTSDARFGLLALPVYGGLAYAGRHRGVDVLLRSTSALALACGSAVILLHWP